MNARFVDIVEQAFSFLEEAGFRQTNSEPGLVTYESDRSFVTVRWDARSGELDAFVGLIPRTGRVQDEYSLADILGLAGLPASDCRPAQVADEGRLESFIATLASNVRTHAQPGLAGDRMYFRRLETFRAAKADAYMREMKLRQVRVEVEKAWRDRQFDKVVKLYTSVEHDLTKSEARKLEYAKQHQSS
ncbi:MAG: hypothetical protein KF911_06130 [Pseudomonadales bacterium]|nr:hypothetical protein [Pseudomonadales bacterium]